MIIIYSYGDDAGPRPPDYIEADAYDCRDLLNPYRFKAFRLLNGQDPQVKRFVTGSRGFEEFMTPIVKNIVNSKNYAFFCRGGVHRSVVVSEFFADACKNRRIPFTLHHLRLGKIIRG